MGLLKSRKDAGREFAEYVDAVEHPPDLDDYVEEEDLGDQDALPAAVTVADIEAQLAARRAQLEPVPEPEDPAEPPRVSAVPQSRKRLGEVLVEQSLLTEEQLQEALAGQAGSGLRLGEYLVDAEILDERALASAIAQQFGLEVVDLRREVPEEDAVASLPEELAREWLAIPLRRAEFGYDVAVADPSEPGLVDKLRDLLRQPPKLYVAGVSDVRRRDRRRVQGDVAG